MFVRTVFLGSLDGQEVRRTAEQIADSGAHPGCAPGQKCEAFRQGTLSLSGIEPKKTMVGRPPGQKAELSTKVGHPPGQKRAALRSGES